MWWLVLWRVLRSGLWRVLLWQVLWLVLLRLPHLLLGVFSHSAALVFSWESSRDSFGASMRRPASCKKRNQPSEAGTNLVHASSGRLCLLRSKRESPRADSNRCLSLTRGVFCLLNYGGS